MNRDRRGKSLKIEEKISNCQDKDVAREEQTKNVKDNLKSRPKMENSKQSNIIMPEILSNAR